MGWDEVYIWSFVSISADNMLKFWGFFFFALTLRSDGRRTSMRLRCWQGSTSALHSFNDNSWRNQESFHPRWKVDSDLIRFWANPTPWGHSFSSLHGGRQILGTDTFPESWVELPIEKYCMFARECCDLVPDQCPLCGLGVQKKRNYHFHIPPLNNRILLSIKLVLHAYLESMGCAVMLSNIGMIAWLRIMRLYSES